MAAQFGDGLFFAAVDAFLGQKNASRLFSVVHGLFCYQLWHQLAAERTKIYGCILSPGDCGGNAAHQAEMDFVFDRPAGDDGVYRHVRAADERMVKPSQMKNAL